MRNMFKPAAATQRMGLIGEITADSASPQFSYDLILPDFSQQPKRPREPVLFNEANKYPSTIGVAHQRQIYASTLDEPLTLYFSEIGFYDDFSESLHSSGSFILELQADSADPITYIIPSDNGFFLFSVGGIYYVLNSSSLNTIATRKEITGGSVKDLEPLRVLNDIIFISTLDNTPRVLFPATNVTNRFESLDLALYNNHLFRAPHEVVAWTYAGRPDRLIWAVRKDGTLLSCTYASEHRVNAWCKHNTKGLFKAVQSVKENQIDRVYFVTERQGELFIECFADTHETQLTETVPLDGAVRTRRRYVPAESRGPVLIRQVVRGTLQRLSGDNIPVLPIQGGGTFTVAITEPDNADYFSAGDYITTQQGSWPVRSVDARDSVRTVIRLNGSRIPTHNSENWYYRRPSEALPLCCLAGQDVFYIDSDGDVRPITINNDGTWPGNQPSDPVVVGHSFTSRVETLPIVAQGSIVADKPKRIFKISVRVQNSSGIEAGTKADDETDLYPVYINGVEATRTLQSGIFEVDIGAEWELDDPLVIESDLPFFLLDLIITFESGDEPGLTRTAVGQNPDVVI